jgi:CHAD domain-containing protein
MSVYQKPIHGLLSKVQRQLDKTAAKPLPQNVHRLRTAIRRLEAVLEAVLPELNRNQRKLLKMLTGVRRRAGKIRDIDIHIAALRALKVTDEPGRKTQILTSLGELRVARQRKLLKLLDSATLQELRKRLKRVGRNLFLPDDMADPFTLASRIFEHVATENQVLNEATLHQYRIRGKRARYIAELAGDAPEAQRFVSHLKHMQDVLGDWHDWLTLSQTVTRLTDSSNSPLISALNNLTRVKFREAIQAVSATKAALLPRPALHKTTAPAISPATPRKSASVGAAATAAVA